MNVSNINKAESISNNLELSQVLESINNTYFPYPAESILELFENHAYSELGQNIAISHNEDSITYKQLNLNASYLAKSIGSSSRNNSLPIAILLERGIPAITTMLAALKLNRPYVYIDPKFPQKRIEYILRDSSAELCVSSDAFQNLSPFPKLTYSYHALLLSTNAYTDKTRTGDYSNPLLTYIYTSGSTGTPKGNQLTQKSVLRLFLDPNFLQLSPSSTFAQVATYSFDASLLEIWGPLAFGAKIAIIDHDTLLSPSLLKQAFIQHNVTHMCMITPIFNQHAQSDVHPLAPLQTLLVGGDRLNASIVRNLLNNPDARPKQLFNAYGPTESSVITTYHHISHISPNQSSVPIGKPVPNTQVFVLNEDLQPAEFNQPGELYIAGDGLSLGYLNLPERTEEAFIPNPFSNNANHKLYKTGDVVKLLTDGTLDFIGRNDNQVKIRGFRIELSEIENALDSLPQITDSIILTKNGRILAFYTQNHSTPIEHKALKDHLSQFLPDYMVPQEFFHVDEFPLTPNNKVDKKALLALTHQQKQSTDHLNLSDTEATLLKIWQQVLRSDDISINDNFFELGGDSILSMQVIDQAYQANITIKHSQIFQHPTIRSLANIIDQNNTSIAIQPITHEPFPLTAIQEWFFELNLNQSNHFHHMLRCPISKNADLNTLQQAFQFLINYHDALRIRFNKTDGKIKQSYAKQQQFFLNHVEVLTSLSDMERKALIDYNASMLARSIDINDGPLINAMVFCDMGSPFEIVIAIHHIVVDGISWRLLIDDLQTVYNQIANGYQPSLPAKTTSFQEWSHKVNEYAQSAKAYSELEHWTSVENQSFTLPHDFDKGPNVESSNTIIHASLDAKQTSKLLKELPKKFHTQINDVLLAGLLKTINRWTGSNSIKIDLEGHGREDIIDNVNLSRTFGWFTGLFPVYLKSDFLNDDTYANIDLLLDISNQMSKIPNHGIGYGILRQLCKDVSIQEKLHTNNKSPIRFNYLGQFDRDGDNLITLSDQPISAPSAPDNERTHQLIIESWVTNGELQTTFQYSNNQYSERTVKQLANNYLIALESLIELCENQAIDYTTTDLDFETLNNLIPDIETYEAVAPLTPLQEGLLFHAVYNKKSPAYFIQQHWDIDSATDLQKLKSACNHIINQHPALRATFHWENTPKALQAFKKEFSPKWSEAYCETIEDLELYLNNERKDGFDLKSQPPIQFTLVTLGDNSKRVLLSVHHILLDGQSASLITSQIEKAYQQLVTTGKIDDVESKSTFIDYIHWQHQQNHDKENAFWANYLGDFSSPTHLDIEKAEKSESTNFKAVSRKLDKAITTQLKKSSKELQVSINTLFQASWAHTLSAYSNTTDIVFGSTVSTRNQAIADVDNIVAPLIMTLPVRVQINENDTIKELLHKVQKNTAEVLENRNVEKASLKTFSKINQNQELFNSSISFENYQHDKSEKSIFSNITVKEYQHYPISLAVVPADEVNLSWSYDQEKFDSISANQIFNFFEDTLKFFIKNPEIQLIQKPLTTNDENILLDSFNDTDQEYPSQKTIVEVFEEQVIKTPDALALSFKSKNYNYEELNAAANCIANFLIKKINVKANDTVALKLERSAEMLITMLGVMKSGAAYMPILPDAPIERINYMLEDSNAKCLLTTKKYLTDSKNSNTNTIDCKNILEFSTDTQNPAIASGLEDLINLLYTSGSTGKPKGVLVKHKGIHNYMDWMQREHKLTPADKALNQTPYNFDMSARELLFPILNGASVVITSEEKYKDPEYLINLIQNHEITYMSMVPSMLKLLLETGSLKDCKSLKRVVCAGDVLSSNVTDSFFEQLDIDLYNQYGPTECSIDVTYINCRENRQFSQMPIGKNIQNTQLYILDKHLRPVPIGVKGQLYLGGEGLARGYHNLEKLTDEKFINNPFNPGTKLYASGDEARWLRDGNIEFIGRIDNQVKIHGLRIELDEIEAHLRRLIKSGDAVVLVQENSAGGKFLVAYLETLPTNNDYKSYLAKHLPSYMIPKQYIEIEKMPLTANGKIDRKALLKIENGSDEIAEETIAKTETEIKLSDIISKIVGNKSFGIQSNVFDLGIDSIASIKLLNEIREAFSISIALKAIIESKDIESLAKAIDFATENNIKTAIKASDYILPLKTGGSKNPLFMIHPIGGTVFALRNPAQHIEDRPVYGIQDPAIGNSNVQFDSLEKMAEKYLADIRKIQKSGPYYLSGWSFGATVAHEIANMLEKEGETIEFLGLFDGWAFYPKEAHEIEWFSQKSEEQHKVLLKQLEDANIDSATIKPWTQLQWNRQQLLMNHNLKTIKTPATLFKAEELLPELEIMDDEKNHWQEYINNTIETVMIPGDHYTMMQDSNGRKLGMELNHRL